MKVRLTGVVLLFVVILGLIGFLIFKIITKDDKQTFKIIYDVTYVGDDGLACLTFYKDGSYSLYDCDSEPTNYFFDSENECTYKAEKSYLKFDCKYNFSKVKKKQIEIITWTKDTIKFDYEGKIKTFNAR